MNLKLNNDNSIKSSTSNVKIRESVIKEERRRTGRYIAILVGIMLFCLALYHAWVRRIPVVASLVVPALIMFVYVAWVLYTASRDKLRALDAEAALQAELEAAENDVQISEMSQHNLEVSVISSKESSNLNTPEENKNWSDISGASKGEKNIRTEAENHFVMPIILINDKPPEDLDQKWLDIVEKVSNSDKLKGFHTRRKYKRKFCRRKRYAVFKRSYSIG